MGVWTPGFQRLSSIRSTEMFASVLLHELGYSVVSLRYKVPVRSITLFVFGGVARVEAEPPSAIVEMWIALGSAIKQFPRKRATRRGEIAEVI